MTSIRTMAHAEPLSVLEIHLDRVARNYLFLKKKLSPGTDCSAVVKADAYGLGVREVAATLHQQGCRHYFVGNFDEGIAVRQVLGDADSSIYVLNGPWGASLGDFVHHRLAPVLNSYEDVLFWKDYVASSGVSAPVLIHLDTGMSRLGLSAADVRTMKNDPEVWDTLNVRYIMSHLACADQPDHPKNQQQLEAFRALTESFGRPFRFSLANSAGILLGKDYHYDLVRPGCSLYGINPLSFSDQNDFHGVVTLKARVLQVRDIVAGVNIGYGATYTTKSRAKIATISVGYADGYLRSLSDRGVVFIYGVACPVVGRVSMDLITVDITGVAHAVQAGDWAEVMGTHQTVDDVARQAGTIGYEILTSLGARYKREYTGV